MIHLAITPGCLCPCPRPHLFGWHVYQVHIFLMRKCLRCDTNCSGRTLLRSVCREKRARSLWVDYIISHFDSPRDVHRLMKLSGQFVGHAQTNRKKCPSLELYPAYLKPIMSCVENMIAKTREISQQR